MGVHPSCKFDFDEQFAQLLDAAESTTQRAKKPTLVLFCMRTHFLV